MSTYLKIKIASLAAEARIIRDEEQRLLHRHRKWKARAASARAHALPPAEFFSIQAHRKNEVRGECRAAHLAQGFIRGTAYRAMEEKCYQQPRWSRVAELVKKYGGHNSTAPVADRLKEWREVTPEPVAVAAE